jgi:drug/metabolite transporter (DMT)-like permease
MHAPPAPRRSATLLALSAIVLWSTLAPLGVSLQHIPAFLLTGIGLLFGSAIGVLLCAGRIQCWRVPGRTLLLGVYGLFGFHFLLFLALRHAPAVQANLVNYLWPLGMVLMAPWLLPPTRLTALHTVAALIGFGGAALAITGGHDLQSGFAWGYVLALMSAFVWASYSLLSQRVAPFATAAMGLFGLVSGLLSLLCHSLLESPVQLHSKDWMLLAALGLGPLGGAFYLWDAALKRGDPRQIGLLSFLTPLLSTLALLGLRQELPSPSMAVATALILGSAALGKRAGR